MVSPLRDAEELLRPRLEGPPRRLRFGEIEACLDGKLLRVDGEQVPMPVQEFDVLVTLMYNTDRIVSRAEIKAQVWHSGPISDRSINLHVQHLRLRLQRHPTAAGRIRTVRGLGYVFDSDPVLAA